MSFRQIPPRNPTSTTKRKEEIEEENDGLVSLLTWPPGGQKDDDCFFSLSHCLPAWEASGWARHNIHVQCVWVDEEKEEEEENKVCGYIHRLTLTDGILMLILFDFLWESKTPCRLSLYIQSDGEVGRVGNNFFAMELTKLNESVQVRCGLSSMQIEMSKLKHHLESKNILLFCL